MLRQALFPLGTALALVWVTLATADAESGTARITWTITPGTESYVNNQTKLAFKKSIGGFRLDNANPAKSDGSASFGYWGKKGIITVYLSHRGPLGCGAGADCARQEVEGFRAEMKKLHGKYDQERVFGLRRRSSPRGAGAMYHFLAFPNGQGQPAFSEVGAVEVGEFVLIYRATFVDRGGLDELATFLRAFGVTRA
jgi:hypothetical protein